MKCKFSVQMQIILTLHLFFYKFFYNVHFYLSIYMNNSLYFTKLFVGIDTDLMLLFNYVSSFVFRLHAFYE